MAGWNDPEREARPSLLDFALQPMFPVDGKLLPADLILLKQEFADLMAGDAKALRIFIKIIKAQDRELLKVQRRGPKFIGQVKRHTFFGAYWALRILGLASSNHRAGCYDDLLEPWVVEAAYARMHPSVREAPDWKFTRKPEENAPPPYYLSDDPDYQDVGEQPVKRSPESTRFQPGKSGNPLGRKAKSDIVLTYDHFWNDKIEVKINGKKRMCSRLEALIYQINLRAIKGNKYMRRILLNIYTNEREARWGRLEHQTLSFRRGESYYMRDDEFTQYLWKLRVANRRTVKRVLLEPWIVELALQRLGERRLTLEEQQKVLRSTSTPGKVGWPQWWDPELRTRSGLAAWRKRLNGS